MTEKQRCGKINYKMFQNYICLPYSYIVLLFYTFVTTRSAKKSVGNTLFAPKVWGKCGILARGGECVRSKHNGLLLWALPALLLSGCSAVGQKAASISAIYGVAAVASLLILIGYCAAVKKKDVWHLLLFSSVLIVNIGYFALSVSKNLDEALLANRLAYLGSVFLPLSMCMIILHVTHISYGKWLPGLLLGIGAVVFLIAASPGYLDIYYKEVTLAQINGVSVLDKVYGPLHGVYLLYLFGYFGTMVSFIVYATLKDKIDSLAYAVLLAIAVFVNIAVWLIEQLVRIDFEILSISYIISECFLLGLNLLIRETEKQKAKSPEVLKKGNGANTPPAETPQSAADPAQLELFAVGLTKLTPKEQAIYRCYVEGMSTAEVMEQLNIKENTLKFHNKNLYGKLGVSSRRQLLMLHNSIHPQRPER